MISLCRWKSYKLTYNNLKLAWRDAVLTDIEVRGCSTYSMQIPSSISPSHWKRSSPQLSSPEAIFSTCTAELHSHARRICVASQKLPGPLKTLLFRFAPAVAWVTRTCSTGGGHAEIMLGARTKASIALRAWCGVPSPNCPLPRPSGRAASCRGACRFHERPE